MQNDLNNNTIDTIDLTKPLDLSVRNADQLRGRSFTTSLGTELLFDELMEVARFYERLRKRSQRKAAMRYSKTGKLVKLPKSPPGSTDRVDVIHNPILATVEPVPVAMHEVPSQDDEAKEEAEYVDVKWYCLHDVLKPEEGDWVDPDHPMVAARKAWKFRMPDLGADIPSQGLTDHMAPRMTAHEKSEALRKEVEAFKRTMAVG